jgi:SAM-dependent methyltransferase
MATQADTAVSADSELKATHRAMWASGDYPSMVETSLTPLGPRLVEACRIGAGVSVLDVAAGTGNASIPAARNGAHVIASDLTPELLQAGRRRAGPRLPAGRDGRAAELDPRRHARRAVSHDGAVRPAAASRRSAAAAMGR